MEIVLNLWVLLKVTAGISLDKDYTRVLEKDTTSDSFPSGLQLPFEIYKGAGALSLVINIKLVPQLHVMSQILGS